MTKFDKVTSDPYTPAWVSSETYVGVATDINNNIPAAIRDVYRITEGLTGVRNVVEMDVCKPDSPASYRFDYVRQDGGVERWFFRRDRTRRAWELHAHHDNHVRRLPL
jgi:hypothetical protein